MLLLYKEAKWLFTLQLPYQHNYMLYATIILRTSQRPVVCWEDPPSWKTLLHWISINLFSNHTKDIQSYKGEMTGRSANGSGPGPTPTADQMPTTYQSSCECKETELSELTIDKSANYLSQFPMTFASHGGSKWYKRFDIMIQQHRYTATPIEILIYQDSSHICIE